jgi:peptidoglycan lytic transglycosylase D
MSPKGRGLEKGSPPALRLTIRDPEGSSYEYVFKQSSWIGRDEDCPFRVDHSKVSRRHAELRYEKGGWWLVDLGSTNGTYVDGERIEAVPLATGSAFTFGMSGPQCSVEIEDAEHDAQPGRDVLSQYENYYLKDSGGQDIGERTLYIRQAFRTVQQRHRRRNIAVAICFTGVLVIVGAYALQQRARASQQEQVAENMFYSLKEVELDLAKFEDAAEQSGDSQRLDKAREARARRGDLQAEYERFVRETGLYTRNLSEEDQLILRITRIFGECEFGMPPNYVSEVKRYIGYWRSTDRLKTAITRAEDRGYGIRISAEMLKHGLPPQFFYLALQESGFDPYAVGPRTYKGYAKGVWQFIPETASKYGLNIGPLYDLPRADPQDERADFQKSTEAAARYLKFIYKTDAQASGLLVMASYNWGEGKVVPMIQALPPNPRSRNFWRLLSTQKEKIPHETYDYVFYIVSAAVIGENPQLFGFDFRNPLRHLDDKAGR